MEFEKVITMLKNNKVMYHYFEFGLVILDYVNKYKIEEDTLRVDFSSGTIYIGKSKIKKCVRPSNILYDIDQCYEVVNEYNKHIGYLFTKRSEVPVHKKI